MHPSLRCAANKKSQLREHQGAIIAPNDIEYVHENDINDITLAFLLKVYSQLDIDSDINQSVLFR